MSEKISENLSIDYISSNDFSNEELLEIFKKRFAKGDLYAAYSIYRMYADKRAYSENYFADIMYWLKKMAEFDPKNKILFYKAKKFNTDVTYLEENLIESRNEAMYYIAEIFHKGRGGWSDFDLTEKNIDEAKKWYKKIIDDEYCEKYCQHVKTNAMFALGEIYYAEKNISKAVEYLKKSAEFGNKYAMHSLANIYWMKEYEPESSEEVIKWLEQTRDFDLIGNLYLSGENFVEKNIPLAVKYFEKAAERGDTNSKWWLAEIYNFGGKDFPKNPEKAEFFYRKVFEEYQKQLPTTNLTILDRMCTMFSYGLGVERDDLKAEKFREEFSKNLHERRKIFASDEFSEDVEQLIFSRNNR